MEEDKQKQLYMSKQEKIAKNYSLFFLWLCIFICFCVMTFNVMFFPAEVIGVSMWPTLNENPQKTDIIYASSWFKARKGDIVIVNFLSTENDWIKRFIADSGDVISFGNIYDTTESTIYLNGEVLDETYLIDKSKNIECINDFKTMIKYCLDNDCDYAEYDRTILKKEWVSYNEITTQYQITLPTDYCIFLGDNRDNSYDCSELGPQKKSTIVAKVMMVIPYGYNIFTYTSAKFFGADI